MEQMIRIELISDLCVSDGGVYNSALDIEICHDKYGFPYIPAKRLKGCLRECGIELNDWGMDIPLDELFGDKGDSKAAVRIGNAYLENYSQMKEIVKNNKNALIFHPQNVLNHFSYIRTQTSIDYETGVADEGSLRTMRVVNKELIFEAEVNITEKYKEYLEKCCNALNYMGISRTRGLGEVKVSFIEEKKEQNKNETDNDKNKNQTKMKSIPIPEDANYLEYVIELEEPVVCKSVNGGEARTLDYLEGSKILGIIMQELREQNVDMSDIFCSNAYIEHKGERCVEVPATVYAIKNNNKQYVNKLYAESDSDKKELKKKQLNMMKHCYVRIKPDGTLMKQDVEMEERYHHRRPENKAIGRAIEYRAEEHAPAEGIKDSKFYQIASICNGQRFCGYITGTYNQIQKIAEVLEKKEIFYMGYSRTSEYGKVRFEIKDVNKKEDIIFNRIKDFAVKLESPAIVYNNNAFYSTNIEDLIEEVNTLLGIECLKENVEKFINYTTIGGYNVTWKRRKPTIEVFDKGTVLIYHLYKPIDLVIPTNCYLGERISEGFGEISVMRIESSGSTCIFPIEEENAALEKNLNITEWGELGKQLCEELFIDYIRIEAVNEAKKMKIDESYKAVVSNMLQMCKENNSLDKVKNCVKERYDNKKSEIKKNKMNEAKNILSIIDKKKEELIGEFEKKYLVNGFSSDKDNYEIVYLVNFLTELKYRLRPKKGRKGEREYEQ